MSASPNIRRPDDKYGEIKYGGLPGKLPAFVIILSRSTIHVWLNADNCRGQGHGSVKPGLSRSCGVDDGSIRPRISRETIALCRKGIRLSA